MRMCGRKLATLFSIVVGVIALSGCGGDPRAEAASGASNNFMTLYYQKSDPKSSLEACTGEARQKIEKEVADIQSSGVAADTASEKPVVKLTFDSYKRINDSEYIITWDVQSSAGQALKVATTMVNKGDKWLVSKFKEIYS